MGKELCYTSIGNKKNLLHDLEDAVKDIRQQLGCLIYEGFISAIPRQWLKHLPRYIEAINLRLEKLQRSVDADKKRQAEVQKHWNKVYNQISEEPYQWLPEEWEIYRLMVEELRVSLFAQELKTLMPVSGKKLRYAGCTALETVDAG